MPKLPVLLLLALAICLSGCKYTRNSTQTLPRPERGYLHWLQKESLAVQTPDLISQVSQSGRVWLQGSQPGRADVLLNAAPNWALYRGAPGDAAIFKKLAAAAAILPAQGITGLYLGDTGEKPDIWLSRDSAPAAQPSASLNFDPAFGNDADYEQLAGAAERLGMEVGAAILGGATGQGPDFLLQARSAPGHNGLYAMLPLPPDLDLPPARDEWDCQKLSVDRMASLASIAPAKLARDAYPWASAGGWAVTGAVAGMDGQPRRWLYRYSEAPARPVLSWQDPSGQAARILSASVIRQTGLLGQSLAGLNLEPLFGLEPAEPGSPSLSPGLEAINDLARQIHRYGGWALQADPAPESVIEKTLAGACDFCRDDIVELLAVFGFLAADGRPVAQLLRDRIAAGLDFSRTARGLGSGALLPRLLAGNPAWDGPRARLAEEDDPPSWLSIQNALKAETGTKFERFMLAWRIGLPGLAFIDFTAGNRLEPWLASSLLERQSAKLATAAPQAVIRGSGGGFGLLSQLPGGGCWLLACNFGVNPDKIKINLPFAISQARDAATGEAMEIAVGEKSLVLALDGQAAMNVIFK